VVEPEARVLEEPTSALDVTLQPQVLARLQRLQRERGRASLLITPEGDVLRARAHAGVGMKDGAIVESGPVAQVLGAPRQAYTQRLVEAAGFSGDGMPVAF
jgi:microcin C transport system ATP-binding protein